MQQMLFDVNSSSINKVLADQGQNLFKFAT